MPDPKTISLTGDEVNAVLTALSVRFGELTKQINRDKDSLLAEMDLIDDVIEKLRERGERL